MDPVRIRLCPYPSYYAFQHCDGRWWLATKSWHESMKLPYLPRAYDRSYDTRSEAEAALAQARKEFASC